MRLFGKKRVSRPAYKIKKETKTEKPTEGLWVKCENCSSMLFKKILEKNLKVCEKCDHHHKLSAFERLELLIDTNSFLEYDARIAPLDPLGFGRDYTNKIREDEKTTSLKDAILSGEAAIGGYEVAIGIMDFHFRGGSMGSVVGEKIARLFERAIERRKPCIIATSSGGAGMQEGVLSLMQMAKTVQAVTRLSEQKIPYISILSDPTTGGVSASFAALGDIIIAEPKAIIGFSGPRVIEQTIKQKLPSGFQSSEFQLRHGFIDQVVHRRELRYTLIRILSFFCSLQKN